MSAPLALRLYRFAYVAFIVYASGKTFLRAQAMAAGVAAGGPHGHLGHLVTPAFLEGLSGAEIVAALGFLVRRIEVWAGAALLAIYAVAAGLDVALGQAPVHLAFYAANVAFFLAVRRAAAGEAQTAPA